ncbi:MAG: hypothetical protein PVF51_07985 [Nitrospirota bacterium]
MAPTHQVERGAWIAFRTANGGVRARHPLHPPFWTRRAIHPTMRDTQW